MPTFDALPATAAAAVVAPPPWLDANRRYAGLPTAADPHGAVDHWQGGDGLSAPLPDAADPSAPTYTAALERTFVVEDCIGDVVERRRNGLLGKEPHWTFEREGAEGDAADGDAAEATEDEALESVTSAVAEWWDTVGAHDVLKRFADGLAVEGRAYLRLHVPHGLLTWGEDGVPRVTAAGPAEALRLIALEHLGPDQAGLRVDPFTRLPLGVVAFAVDAEPDPVRPAEVAADAPAVAYELTYPASTTPGAPTVLRHIAAEGAAGGAEGARAEFDLRGTLLLFEGRARPLVDEHMRRNQRDLNTARTMLAISNHKAGFPELHFINIKPPTTTEVDAEGARVEVPTGYTSGPGQVGFWATYEDENGKPGPGSVVRFGPVENENLRASAEVARAALYRRAKQMHALALLGADLSGEAMIQGQGEYLLDLMNAKAEVDRAGKWLLETAWALAENPAGAAVSVDLRAVFDCRVNAGPLSSAMRQQVLAEFGAGLISRETAMSLLGVDDVEAEEARLRREAEEPLDPERRDAIEAGRALRGDISAARLLLTTPGGDGAADEPEAP